MSAMSGCQEGGIVPGTSGGYALFDLLGPGIHDRRVYVEHPSPRAPPPPAKAEWWQVENCVLGCFRLFCGGCFRLFCLGGN